MSHEHSPDDRETYEAPRVVEDLPLESMSLACNNKFDFDTCEAVSGEPS